MEKRTAEIIMICKGNHDYGEDLSYKQAISAFLSDHCLCPIDYYTEAMINNIILQAAFDYVDSFKEHRPSSFLRYVKETYDLHHNPLVENIKRIDIYEAICIAFEMAQVKDENGYINGFTEENTQRVRKWSDIKEGGAGE